MPLRDGRHVQHPAIVTEKYWFLASIFRWSHVHFLDVGYGWYHGGKVLL
jgi:hypothetical protein